MERLNSEVRKSGNEIEWVNVEQGGGEGDERG